MSSNKFLSLVSGVQTLLTAIATSAGVGDANKIVMTDTSGKLDSSLMPVGVGADTASILASEALSAGDFVNIYDNAGTANVRKADSSNGRDANGFVLASVSSGANASVYKSGTNTGRTGLTAGLTYYLSTSGGLSSTPPTAGSGVILQVLGTAFSATSIVFADNGFISTP